MHVYFNSLSLEELQERVTKLQLIESLSLQPAAFSEHMGLRVYPELDGTDHARMLYYFSTLLKCEGPLQGGITADGHVKLLKKLKPVAAGLDYKLLLASADNVIDVLSPCITMSNVNTFAKLAKQIPDGRGGMLDASVVYCTWAVKFFWEGDGKRQPDTTTAWIHRYEACGEFLHKLQADHIPTFLQAILYSKKPTQLLEVDCRQEIGRRILKYCRQQTSKKKMPDNEKTSWESAVSVVNGYLEHLTTLSDPVIMAMRSSDNSRVQEYYNVYNLSMGNTDQVKQLLLRVILEGEMSLDQVHSLVSVGPGRHGNIRVLVQEAVEHVLLSLSKKDSSFKPLNIVDPLKSLENIVTNVEKHGEGLVTGEQLMSQLRPFCSDPTVNVQPRLDVLHILEKSFSLSEDDLVLLTLYRTQAVITEVWPDIQVAEAEISTPVSRGRLFSTLLEKSSHSELGKQEFLALAKLLKLWPTFGYKEVGTEQPWVSLLKAMVSHRSGEVHTLVLEVFKSSGMQLTAQETEALFKGLVRHASYLTAVKLGLLSGHDNLYTAAVQTLADTPTLHTDDELLEQLLKLQLVSKLISTPHYPAIVQYLLANQHPETKSHEESCDHLSIQRLAGQLKEAGFEAEAVWSADTLVLCHIQLGSLVSRYVGLVPYSTGQSGQQIRWSCAILNWAVWSADTLVLCHIQLGSLVSRYIGLVPYSTGQSGQQIRCLVPYSTGQSGQQIRWSCAIFNWAVWSADTLVLCHIELGSLVSRYVGLVPYSTGQSGQQIRWSCAIFNWAVWSADMLVLCHIQLGSLVSRYVGLVPYSTGQSGQQICWSCAIFNWAVWSADTLVLCYIQLGSLVSRYVGLVPYSTGQSGQQIRWSCAIFNWAVWSADTLSAVK
ncbi:hypothetical protein DPMN_048318 [Dreissena polymorpha]|uniref:NBAS subunit of NRZ tethering complex C-terminal domain-containing protein n=1 Tax=Dreissena polymorpha TaxID=45954 RepID=A0A9D4I2A6_DREPO|nr:hypothetical protein DPMN_048318 [Dreissena polymorpha]